MKSFSIKQQNNLLNLITHKNSSNSNNQNTQLIEAENLLKGYVNNLVKQTVLGFDVEERKNILMKKARNKENYSGSSSNLRVKRKRGIMKKKEKEEIDNYKRRMSYNIDTKNRFNINENEKKNEKKIEKKNEKKKIKKVEIKIESSSEDNKTNEQEDSTKRAFKRKNKKFKTMNAENIFEDATLNSKKKDKINTLPRYKTSFNKSLTNKLNSNRSFKGALDIEDQYKKKKTNKEELFSLLKTPQKFEGENDISDSLILDSEDNNLLHFSGLSNKNILQLNEIKKELKKTLIGKKTIIKKKLSSKSFIDEDVTLNEGKSRIETHIDETDKEKYRILTRKGYVYDSYDDEENLDERDITNHLNPDSFTVKLIDFFVAICAFYNIIFIPFFLGKKDIYCSTGNYFNLENIIENFIDFVFLFDFFITFFIGYYNFDEVLVTEYKSIATNYLKTWFFIDFICAIPVKTLIMLFNKICYDEGFKTTPLYNGNYYYLLMLIRLLKIFQVISKNKFLIYIENELTNYENFNSYGRLLISVIIFFMSLHIVACIFIFIGKNEYPSWIVNFNHQNKNFNQLYLVAIYYTITTVTTVGYGDLSCVTTIEKLFGLFMEIVGIIAYSWALTSMSNYVKIENDKQIDFRNKSKILDEIKLSYPQLPDDLYDRTIRFLKYKHDSEKKDNHILFQELPVTLRNTLIYEMYKPIINSFNFFKNFSNSDFIVKVILAFKPILALKNDILIKDGDFVEDIIFVKKGRLSLELPIEFGNPKNARSVRRDSLLGIRRTTLFFNSVQRENTVSPDLKTNLFVNQTRSLKKYTNKSTNSNLSPKKATILNSLEKTITNIQQQAEANKSDIQNFRVLEIRKNEHFGDILMFLNQRSPLCLKVKSKKAELFFLNKADAIGISTSYPQYWKRINKKSLFNMEQIKRLTNKIIKIVSNAKGLAEPKKHSKKVSDNIEGSDIDLMQEDESDLKTIPSISDESDIDDTLYKKNYQIDDLDEEGENENENENEDSRNEKYDNKNNIDTKKIKQRKNIVNSPKYDITSNSLNTILENESFSSHSNTNSSSVSNSQSKSNSDSNNLKKKNNLQFQKKSQHKSSNSSSLSESGFEKKRTKKNNIINDSDSNESKSSKSSKGDFKFRKKAKIKGTITPYNEEDINNEIYPEENFVTTGGSNVNNIIHHQIFQPIQDNISVCSTEISFSINSEYENIDDLSDHIYSKDMKFRKKIKKYIRYLINNKNQTLFSHQGSFPGSLFKDSGIKKNISINNNKHHYHHHFKNYNRTPSLNPTMRNHENAYGFNLSKNGTINHNLTNDNLKQTFKRNNSGQFDKVKVNKFLSYEIEDKPNKQQSKKDILDVIGHNIEKNVMNLNNPEQFYSEFFLKFMNKKKGNNHQSIESKKEELDFINKIERKATLRDKGLKIIKPKI